MGIHVQISSSGSRIVDQDAGKVYTPKEWENELRSRNTPVNEEESPSEEKEENEEKKDASGVQEDTDEE